MSDNESIDDEIEDFDDLDLSDDSLDADFETGSGSLADVWKNSPIVKVAIVVGGLVTVIGGIILFGGGNERPDFSRVSTPVQVKQAPGTAPVSETYRDSIEERNIQQREEAIRTGGSAIPEPIEPPVGRINLPADGEEDDPLARWRRYQEELQRDEPQPVPIQPDIPQQTDNSGEVVNALAQAFARQMESILQNLGTALPKHNVIQPAHDFEDAIAEAEASSLGGGSEANLANPQGAGALEDEFIDIIVPAGTIEFGQTITDASSDAEAPVLARILTGPLRGSRLIGSFEVEDEGDEFLVIRFNTAVINGISVPITALALDPEEASPGLVTDIDRRLFRRIIIPAAASFVAGLGSGIADAGSEEVTGSGGDTVTTTQEDLGAREEFFTGVEIAFQQISSFLAEDAANIEPLVRVRPGTPVAIMFLQPVTDEQGAFFDDDPY